MAERNFNSLQNFGVFLGRVAVASKEQRNALEKASKLLQSRSREVLGTYEYKWPALAEFTQDQRVRLGFPADEPLKRTGALGESIKYTVEQNSARVGSEEDNAVWQELGTRSIPPRSFLRRAAVEKEKEIVRIIKEGLYNPFGGRRF